MWNITGGVMSKAWRVLSVTILLAGGLSLAAWGFWPPARDIRESTLQGLDGELGLPEARVIRLEYSPAPRLGDSQVMELRILPAEESAGTETVYDAYTVLAEARLDMPLANTRPAGVVSAPLTSGSGATFYWDVSPRVDGEIEGTVWTYLRFIPKGGGEETRQAVSAQMVRIRSVSVLGRTGTQARVLGVAGLGLGILLGWPIVRRKM